MTKKELRYLIQRIKENKYLTRDETNYIIKVLKQEPCEDAISRKMVLDKIKEVCFSKEQEWVAFRVSQGSNGQRDLIIKFIESLPNIQSIPNSSENLIKWIPCSDRLPLLRDTYKISDDVLITNGYEIDMGYLVERTSKIFWHYYGSESEVGIKDEDNDATAWMPLPEPYKAESEK